jgi:hypothetical protein
MISYHLAKIHIRSSNISLDDVNKRNAKYTLHLATDLLFRFKQEQIMLLKFRAKYPNIYYHISRSRDSSADIVSGYALDS